MAGKNKLLIVGMNSVHTYKFIRIIDGYFDEVLLLTNSGNEVSKVPARIFNFSLRNPFSAIRTFFGIKKLINQYRPDVVHMHQANTASWLTLQASQGRAISVVSVWGSDILRTPSRGFFFKEMIRRIFQKSTYITADGTFLADEVKKLSPQHEDPAIINFGIEPVCTTETDLLNCFEKKENIIYSNRLHKKLYRVDRILRAFASFQEKAAYKDWRLVIAGSGEETESLKRLAQDLGIGSKTAFTGWIEKNENYFWYRRAKLFVSIPQSDATSLSLLEAMSAACIPVLSDHPSKKEWIQQAGNGIYTQELCAEDFERALQLATAETAKNNFNLVMEKGTEEISRRKFFSFYNRILSK